MHICIVLDQIKDAITLVMQSVIIGIDNCLASSRHAFDQINDIF